MKFFGAHVSTSGGIELTIERALQIGAKALGLFVKNQKRWVEKPLTIEKISKFKKSLESTNKIKTDYIVAHAGYLINLGNPILELQKKSFDSLCDEISRCESLGIKYLNIHPGSSLGKMDINSCLKQIAKYLTKALEEKKYINILLENSAGQGFQLGYFFEQLAEIIHHIPNNFKSRIGICFDTCHAFSAGYNLIDEEKCEETFSIFNKVIGIEYLKAIHLNDSKGKLGERIDRHESLGFGAIGFKCFSYIAKNKMFCNMPIILETPNQDLWYKEISTLNNLST